METIMLLPSLKTAKKQAFEVAKSQTELSDVIIYPITEYIGAIYHAKEKIKLHFPKMIRKLFENDIKKFIAVWRDAINDKLFIFVSTGEDIEVFKFNDETMYAGLITAITSHYKKDMRIYCIEDDELKSILKDAIPTINEANEKQGKPTIRYDDIIWAEGKVNDEDYKLLIRKKSFLDAILNKLKDKREKSLSALPKDSQFTPTTMILLVILAVLAGYYYYDAIYLAKKKVEETPKISSAEQLNKIKKKNFVYNAKKSALAIYLLKNNLADHIEAANDTFFIIKANDSVTKLFKKYQYLYGDGVNCDIFGNIADVSPRYIKEIGIRQNRKDVTLQESIAHNHIKPADYSRWGDIEYAMLEFQDTDAAKKKLYGMFMEIAGNGLHKSDFFITKEDNNKFSTIVVLKKVKFNKGVLPQVKQSVQVSGSNDTTKGSSGVLEAM